MLELRPLQAPLEGDGLAAVDLVLAEDLEVEVAEFAAVGLGEAGVEGLQHAGQSQGLE
ncbi:hypothetical protein [Streptomyces sp. NPDC048350]|uniref:hypothetical protein n=1 Tax=Streptomyces sp. NPDC048350 TaxID=3365538 RepID=UPI00371336F5